MKKILIPLAIILFAPLDGLTEEVPSNLFKPLEETAVSVDGGLSRGVTWGDMDGDGFPDLAVANTIGQLDFLYHNNGDGSFIQRHEIPFTLNNGWTEGITWIDFDNDGDLDIFVAGGDPNYLYENDGAGTLTPFDAGPLTSEVFDITEGCWADFDNDGFLDVFLANRSEEDDVLFRNIEGKGFRRVSGPFEGNGGNARACAWGDADNDGDLDIYVGNFLETDSDGNSQKQKNFLYLNNGDGTFSEVTDHILVNTRELTYGLSWVDFDYDGDHDLFISNLGRTDLNLLYENRGNLEFVSRTDLSLSYDSLGPSKGHTWGDFDNDGDLDLFVANGTEWPDNRNFLFLNNGAGNYEKIRPEAIVQDNFTSAGAAWADYDNDGDLDIFVAHWGQSDEDNRLYQNQTTGRNWLKVRLRGVQSNSFGIGALARLEYIVDGELKIQTRVLLPKTGYASSNEPILHFGLAGAEKISFLEIIWPSGKTDQFEDLAINLFVVATEGAENLQPLKMETIDD